MWPFAKKAKAGEGKDRAGVAELGDISRGLYHAASSTTALVAQHYVNLLEQFFDELDDGTLQAKVVRVAVDDHHEVTVPLVSLVSPMAFTLDRMKVGLSVRMEKTAVVPATHPDADSATTRAEFAVSISPRRGGDVQLGDVMTIDLEFIAKDPPEGVMRLIDAFSDQIRPIQRADGQTFPAAHPIHLKTTSASIAETAPSKTEDLHDHSDL